MDIQGKYNSAKIFTENIDAETLSQLYNMLNIPCFSDSTIAIMPDVHIGKGSVVGFTMTFNNYINPNVIGVDIGCGIAAYNLGPQVIDLEIFDQFVHNHIPAGSSTHSKINKQYVKSDATLEELIKRVAKTEQQRIWLSIGSMGGGNHFIELDRDEDENIWLVIHSGSRNLGLQVCNYHRQKAKEVIKDEFRGAGAYHGMEFMSLDKGGKEYLKDMQTAQAYALLNREVMARIIIEGFFNKQLNDCESISSIHNYLNFSDNIVRKGAISAHEGERVIIPLNMRDGCIIGTGKGNPHWNYSAPHGAGRLLKRSKTRQVLSLEEYQETMKGIYSSCISQETLDESPMAYKDAGEIKNLITDSVAIDGIIKPIYNFKA